MMRRILSGLQFILFLGGFCVVAFVITITLRAWLFQRAALEELETVSMNDALPAVADDPIVELPLEVRENGELLGRLDVPRLKISQPILEGTAESSLSLGLGHISGTAMPGTTGNIGIAGHRDTVFRPLKDIQISDEIVLSTPFGKKSYHVTLTQIVDPGDVYVLDQDIGDALTLVTCFPFYYVGHAPRRFIVRALPNSSAELHIW